MHSEVFNISPKISIVASFQKKQAFNGEYLKQISNLLSSEEISHEFILVFGAKAGTAWRAAADFSFGDIGITSLRIGHSNGLHAMQLAGILRSNARLVLTLNPYINYDPHSILSLLFVADKSNCELVYGCPNRKYSSGLLIHRMLFVPLSFIAGLPSYTSSYRLIKRKYTTALKIKTPFYFHLDQLLKAQIENPSYLNFPNPVASSYADGFLYDLKHLLVGGFLIEILTLTAIAVDIGLLFQGKLWWAFVIGLSALALIWLLYLLKWRRRLAFKMLAKRP